jgi:UDPglucose--hexose-1-phosphate uridylyltransferase
MAKYVPDNKTQRWVIISPSRTKRPDDAKTSGNVPSMAPAPRVCPFCAGNESLTPPEVYRIGSGEKDAPGWQVRVVPNKFPITDTHEVIVHSPSDTDDIEKLPLEQVQRIILAYRDRFRAHENDGHVILFCNHGLHAGASLKHPHTQLVVVPKQISLDAVSIEQVANVVEDTTNFVTYCPDFSQWPYEVWIAPKELGKRFSDLTDMELPDLAGILQRTLQKVQIIYDTFGGRAHDLPFGYNYYVYHGENWFLRIIPRLVHRAGFELGSGLSVNVVDPAEAAKQLKLIVT